MFRFIIGRDYMKKIFMFMIFTIALSSCSNNNEDTYDKLIVDYFETTDYTYTDTTITININSGETTEDLVAKGNFLINELPHIDCTLIIYNTNNIFPIVIVMKKTIIDDEWYNLRVLTIDYDNLKEN